MDFHKSGTLTVRGFSSGKFEIFRVASETPLQFVSEHAAEFNNLLTLEPGSYLVLADCSSELISIYPGKHLELVTHRVNFVPFVPPSANDRFAITCMRADRAEFRQTIADRYSIDLLFGAREVLVGMKPLSLKFNEEIHRKEPTLKSFVLSSIAVGEKFSESEKYFVSPVDDLAPHTESQSVGSRQFLLPGKYLVEMNGTQRELELSQGFGLVVKPSRITVKTSDGLDLEKSDRISGSPQHFEMNGDHFLKLNQEYSVLPGKLSIRMSQEKKATDREIKPGEVLELKAKSVLVDASCAKDDWKCLGQRKVKIFDSSTSLPIAEGVTDVPILYLGDVAFLGVEGSRDIKIKLSKERDQKFRLGYLNINPKPTHVFGAITDLLRIETASGQMLGSTLDLQLDAPSRVPLVEGPYALAHYVSQTSSDGNRKRTPISVYIKGGSEQNIEITTYLSEKRMLSLKSKEKKK